MSSASAVAIIPARSGSKRVAKKNLRLVGGKALLQIAVEQAVKSSVFDKVIVSTDSPEILELGVAAGACPFELRPEELSGDSTSSLAVVTYVVGFLGEEERPDFVYTLPPTTPFRTSQNLIEAHTLLQSHPQASGVLSCVEVPHRYSLEKQMIEVEGILRPNSSDDFPSEFEAVEITPRLARNSAIYGTKSEFLSSGLAGHRPVPYKMSMLSSIDIDTEEDLALADALAKSSLVGRRDFR